MRVEAMQVVTTTAEKKDAETLAQAVLENRLALACRSAGRSRVAIGGMVASKQPLNGR